MSKILLLSTYYPQGNGLVESTIKNLIRILKWLINDNKPHTWHTMLKFVLWADHTTIKFSTSASPFRGMEHHSLCFLLPLLVTHASLPLDNM